jgi:hypothetical protein
VIPIDPVLLSDDDICGFLRLSLFAGDVCQGRLQESGIQLSQDVLSPSATPDHRQDGNENCVVQDTTAVVTDSRHGYKRGKRNCYNYERCL